MYEKYLRKSDILHKDGDQLLASLFRMSLFHTCFLHIFPVFSIAGILDGNGWKIFLSPNTVAPHFPLLAKLFCRLCYPSCKVVWWWPLYNLSTITMENIKQHMLSPIITNTVICTFNIRLFNLAKTILIWAKKCLNEAVLFENAVLWKYTWNWQTLPTSKFRWLRCCHPIPGALAAQSIAKLSWQG